MTLSKRLRDRQSLAMATARLQAATPKRPERLGAIYVIKVGDRHKIGLSLNPEQRIAGMQLPERPQVVLIYRTKKARGLEQALHRKYAAHRLHGEWFKLDKPQLVEIAKVCEAWKRQVT